MVIYNFDILVDQINYNPDEDIVEYKADVYSKNNYYGSIDDNNFIKIMFEEKNQEAKYYVQVISETMKQYAVIEKGSN